MKKFRVSILLVVFYIVWMILLSQLSELAGWRVEFYTLAVPLFLSPGFFVSILIDNNLSTSSEANLLSPQATEYSLLFLVLHLVNILTLLIIGFYLNRIIHNWVHPETENR